jgi:site-specific DNA recombinase
MAQNKLVAAYCRVSTLEQKKKGLGMDIQVRDVTAFAEARALVIDLLYRDEAQSGAAENRKELNRLVRACERGDIGVVIIPALDRLSRDVRIAENLFYRFAQCGVQVLIADMPNYDGANRRDILIRQIREAIAEDNRKEIIERLWKARQERVRKGKAPGGNTPYGYRRNRKRWEPEPSETAIVQAIFERNAADKSAVDIANELNCAGFKRRNGGDWTSRQVLDILSREDLYARGTVKYGEIEGADQNLVLIAKGQAGEVPNEIGAAL